MSHKIGEKLSSVKDYFSELNKNHERIFTKIIIEFVHGHADIECGVVVRLRRWFQWN